MSELKKLGRHSAIYGVGSALGAVGSFLLLPLYTHSLTVEEYGEQELLFRLCNVVILIAFLGVKQAYIRLFFDKRDDEDWQQTVTGSALFFVALSCAAMFVLLLPFRELILTILFKGRLLDSILLLALAWIPLEMLVDVGLTYFRIQMRSVTFVSINAVRLVLYLTVNVILVYWLRLGVAGVFCAQIVATGVVAVGILIYLIGSQRLRISTRVIWEMIKFGVPYLPTTILAYPISNADRYFLSTYVSLEAVGIFALAVKIGTMGSTFLSQPFMSVWSPFLLKNYDVPDGRANIARAVTYFTLANAAFALATAVLSPIVLPFITGENYTASYVLIPIVCLAAVFYSLSDIADAGILISKKTRYKPVVFGLTSVVAIVANMALIPLLNVWGAAIASVITMVSLVAINLHFSNRFYRLPIEWRSVAMVFVSALVTFAVCEAVYLILGDLVAGQLLCVLAMGLFPVLLWVCGFFTSAEMQVFRNFLKKLRRNSAVVAPVSHNG